jgi:MATE family multidrug resistance protein
LFFVLPLALGSILFPKTVFGLLTNHGEVIESIDRYVSWLLPLLAFNAIGLILEGYFIGLTEGYAIRNAALIGMLVGFAPTAILAWFFNNNHLLWLAISLYMLTVVLVLGGLLPGTLRKNIGDSVVSTQLAKVNP